MVLDTGPHSKGWTEDQAVKCFQENSAITDLQARSEVQRYMVLPGQATSHKIGMIKIQELHAKTEKSLGDTFDIRATFAFSTTQCWAAVRCHFRSLNAVSASG